MVELRENIIRSVACDSVREVWLYLPFAYYLSYWNNLYIIRRISLNNAWFKEIPEFSQKKVSICDWLNGWLGAD